MDVTVRFFATYREATGLRVTTVAIPEAGTVRDLVQHLVEAYPRLQAHLESMLVAVNEEFADETARLRSGDEVALLPPVSGGTGPMCRVQAEVIDEGALVAMVKDRKAGAVVLFLGTVRADAGVRALEYEAYESMAVKKMEALRAAAKEKFGVTELAIVHRTGRLPPGETSVAVACASPHRPAAFAACAWAMDELKHVVPIWKTEREEA